MRSHLLLISLAAAAGKDWKEWLHSPGSWWARDHDARALLKRVLHISTSASSRAASANKQFSQWSSMLLGEYSHLKRIRCDAPAVSHGARDHVCGAVNQLMAYYKSSDCIFHSCFSRHQIGAWATGPIMLALTSYTTATGKREFTPIIDSFFQLHTEWVLMTFLGAPPDYTADDQLWHVVAYLKYYEDVSHDPKHLDEARSIFDAVMRLEEQSGWKTNGACAGGLYWHNRPGRYRNTVTNALGIEAAARLSRLMRRQDRPRKQDRGPLAKQTRLHAPIPTKWKGIPPRSTRGVLPTYNYTQLAWGLWEWLVDVKGVSERHPVSEAAGEAPVGEVMKCKSGVTDWTEGGVELAIS